MTLTSLYESTEVNKESWVQKKLKKHKPRSQSVTIQVQLCRFREVTVWLNDGKDR